MFLFQIQFGQNWAFILFLVCDDLIGANLFLKQCIKVLPQFTNVSVKQYLPTYLPTNLPTYQPTYTLLLPMKCLNPHLLLMGFKMTLLYFQTCL